MKSKRVVLLAAAALAAIIWIVNPIRAFNPQPEPPGNKWGMAGIAQTETGRLNVVSDDMDACTIGLGFLDSEGMLIKGAFKAMRPGRAEFLDLLGSQTVPRGEQRMEIRPFLQDATATTLPSGFPPGPCKNIMATFEVFERSTGKTSFLAVPAVQRLALTPIAVAGQ